MGLPEVVNELTEPFVKSTLMDFPKAVSGEQEAGRSLAQIAVPEELDLLVRGLHEVYVCAYVKEPHNIAAALMRSDPENMAPECKCLW